MQFVRTTAAAPDRDAPTRERVARSILENGPSTAVALAERLELTPAAVRRHLEHLVETGTVEGREQKIYGSRGRGRPARVFALTDAGREAQKAAAGGPAPWEEVGVEGDVTALELRDLVGQVVNAARQVLHAGEAAQIAQAKDVLRDTRRTLYRILAEDSPETPADEAGDSK